MFVRFIDTLTAPAACSDPAALLLCSRRGFRHPGSAVHPRYSLVFFAALFRYEACMPERNVLTVFFLLCPLTFYGMNRYSNS